MNKSEWEEMLKQRPFGWEFDDPQTFDSFSFERMDPFYWRSLLEDNWKLGYYVGLVYLITIFGLRRWMRSRPAFELKGPLFIWNLSLGIFSLVGLLRTGPELVMVLSRKNGLFNSICSKTGMNVPSGAWGLLFTFSKFIELGDTLFIVLRKRPLVFLQWYHHLATLMVVWTVATLVEPIVRWYVILNYLVHSLMYPYFAFKTIGIQIPSKVANLITTLQLTQMIVGFSVNMASLVLLKLGYDCVRYPTSIKAFNLVYGSFILLFGKLFYESVMKSGRGQKAKSKSS